MFNQSEQPKKEKTWVDQAFEWLRGPAFTWLRNYAYDWFLKQLVLKSITGAWATILKFSFDILVKKIIVPEWDKVTRKIKSGLNKLWYKKKAKGLDDAAEHGSKDDIKDHFDNMP